MQVNVSLELYKKKKEKDALHPLVIRFAVDRKTFRYQTGTALTVRQWQDEKKARYILDNTDHKSWSYPQFVDQMGLPIVPKDSITRLWAEFYKERVARHERGNLSWRTLELDGNLKSKLDSFLAENPILNNVHVWKENELVMFQNHITKTCAASTAKIYLEAFRTFFSWCVDSVEVIARNPFRKFKIAKGDSSWFPYSYKELKVLLALEPITGPEKRSMKWVKLLLYSGGADPKDFSEMKWKQIQSEAIQFNRVKVSKSSKAGKKLLYLTDEVLKLFDEIKGKKGKPDDYVLDVFQKGLTEKQNTERHKTFIWRLNNGMRSMIDRYNKEQKEQGRKTFDVHFVIKRLRPTAATLALASTSDVNFVSKMLMHSNLQQTSVYLAHLPNDEIKLMQKKYEEAIKAVMI
jgi:integrase